MVSTFTDTLGFSEELDEFKNVYDGIVPKLEEISRLEFENVGHVLVGFGIRMIYIPQVLAIFNS